MEKTYEMYVDVARSGSSTTIYFNGESHILSKEYTLQQVARYIEHITKNCKCDINLDCFGLGMGLRDELLNIGITPNINNLIVVR